MAVTLRGDVLPQPSSVRTLGATQTLVSGHLTAMPGESRDELVERILAQLSDSERRSLEETAEAFDTVARGVGLDVVAELERGRDLLEIVAMVAERRRRRTP